MWVVAWRSALVLCRARRLAGRQVQQSDATRYVTSAIWLVREHGVSRGPLVQRQVLYGDVSNSSAGASRVWEAACPIPQLCNALSISIILTNYLKAVSSRQIHSMTISPLDRM